MLRLSVSELSTPKWSFEEDVVNYHRAGFNAIGISCQKLEAYGEEKAVELLDEYNLQISSLSCIGGFTGSNGLSYRQNILVALDAIQLAADIGAKNLVVLAGGRHGHTQNHAKRILRTALKVLAEAAQAVGVQLALEPIHAGCARESFLNTVPDCLDIIASIDNPNLGITFDSYHLAQDVNALPWLESIIPYVRLVQLGDAKHAPMGEQNRCLLGHGRIPLASIVALFQQGGYDGFYEIEVLGASVEHLGYEQILGQSKRAAFTWQLQAEQ